MLLLLIVFAGDTGAYFAGRPLGVKSMRRFRQRRLGSLRWIGGVHSRDLRFCSLRVARVGGRKGGRLGALCGGSGVCGDLVESLVRACGVKDSGSIMPGHGGALDRIDSLLLGAPVMYVLVHFLVVAA